MRQNINFIEHQRAVYFKMSEDNRLSPFHVSMYHALFIIWNECGFDTELSINRNDVMKLSKIGNANTYTKVLKELTDFGYIIYKPSFNPLIGSRVTITTFGKGSGKGNGKGSVKGASKGSGKGGGTLYKQLNNETNKQLNNIIDKEKTKRFVPPSLNDVVEYCQERKNLVDASKFIDHYTSNGWMVGRNKMKDWKASIRTWEKNSTNFNQNQNGTERPKSKAEQLNDDFERVARECGIIPANTTAHGGVDTRNEFTDFTQL